MLTVQELGSDCVSAIKQSLVDFNQGMKAKHPDCGYANICFRYDGEFGMIYSENTHFYWGRAFGSHSSSLYIAHEGSFKTHSKSWHTSQPLHVTPQQQVAAASRRRIKSS